MNCRRQAIRNVLDTALSASAREPTDPMDLAVHAMARSIDESRAAGAMQTAGSFVPMVFARTYSR